MSIQVVKMYNKDKSFIEDTFLIYQDAGQINTCNVVGKKSFDIKFTFNENVKGMAKLAILDKIIERLKNKYEYISLNKDCMSVFLDDRNVKYTPMINYSLVEDAEKYIDAILDNIKDVSKHFDYATRNKDVYYGQKYADYYKSEISQNLVLQYSTSSKTMRVNHELFSYFNRKYGLSNYLYEKDIIMMFARKVNKLNLGHKIEKFLSF